MREIDTSGYSLPANATALRTVRLLFFFESIVSGYRMASTVFTGEMTAFAYPSEKSAAPAAKMLQCQLLPRRCTHVAVEPSLALRRLLFATDALRRASASESGSVDFLLKRFFRPAMAVCDYKVVVGGMVAVAAIARHGGQSKDEGCRSSVGRGDREMI